MAVGSDFVEEKELLPELFENSVVETPPNNRTPRIGPLILQLATTADSITPWGKDPVKRDRELREFWHTESLLASAVYGVSIRNASFAWHIEGTDKTKPRPKNTINKVTEIIQRSNRGKGWYDLILKTCIDLYTADNGAFWEIIRVDNNNPTSPVINFAHLDSGRCWRTGDPEYPVIYRDFYGREHAMPWWRVETLEEFPSPIEEMYGIQYCAVTRALLAAQILRDISIYKKEKVGGNFTRAIDIIGGVSKSNIDDAVLLAEEQNLNRGLYRFSQPVIIPGVDPTHPLSHVHIDLATLPDSFNEDTTFKWYIAQLALAFGVDYQEFAPLMSGNLGSSGQSEILHLKTRGKGPALIMTMLEDKINSHLPYNVRFEFKEQDIRSDRERAEARFIRAKERALLVRSGEIDAIAARQLAVESGDIPEWMIPEIESRLSSQPTEQPSEITFGTDQIIGGIDSHTERKGYQKITAKDIQEARRIVSELVTK